MKKLILAAAISAGPAFADPLDLLDYDALFVEKADQIEVISETRSALSIGSVILLRDTTEEREYTGIDESGQGAVGCFVSILATIESSLQACEALLPPEQAEIQATYTQEALSFYAANVLPQVDRATAQDRYDALVASQIAAARPFCASLDVVTDLADRLFASESRAEIAGMMSVPRLPVSNPCL